MKYVFLNIKEQENLYQRKEKYSEYLLRKRKKRHLGSYLNGDKTTTNQNIQNWINLATEMNDNDTSHFSSQNSPGNNNQKCLSERVSIKLYVNQYLQIIMNFYLYLLLDASKAWPTYGTSIILPSPMFGLALQPMR